MILTKFGKNWIIGASILNVVLVVSILILTFYNAPAITHSIIPHAPHVYAMTEQNTFWKYQCVDTMKTSRDKARAWVGLSDLQDRVDKEMKAIYELGANCAAIDTPYDPEFLPYLKTWVQGARSYNLNVWFRGNFAGWEKWFDYAKLSDTNSFLIKTSTFISENKDIFRDNDIFTAAPEAENGGPFNQVEVNEYPAYRKFLIDEKSTMDKSFSEIDKKITTDWLSMNGGLAKRMYDAKTINALGKAVSLDHYIKDTNQMSEFINYFYNNFGAKVSIGEFGAPIPDINGNMTNAEQAEFINKLFQQLTKEKDKLSGINYWTLYDSSTALLNEDYTHKASYDVLKKYYSPTIVKGSVLNNDKDPVANVEIKFDNGYSTKTNNNGDYNILIPAEDTNIHVIKNGKEQLSNLISGATKRIIIQDYTVN